MSLLLKEPALIQSLSNDNMFKLSPVCNLWAINCIWIDWRFVASFGGESCCATISIFMVKSCRSTFSLSSRKHCCHCLLNIATPSGISLSPCHSFNTLNKSWYAWPLADLSNAVNTTCCCSSRLWTRCSNTLRSVTGKTAIISMTICLFCKALFTLALSAALPSNNSSWATWSLTNATCSFSCDFSCWSTSYFLANMLSFTFLKAAHNSDSAFLPAWSMVFQVCCSFFACSMASFTESSSNSFSAFINNACFCSALFW